MQLTSPFKIPHSLKDAPARPFDNPWILGGRGGGACKQAITKTERGSMHAAYYTRLAEAQEKLAKTTDLMTRCFPVVLASNFAVLLDSW
jgi:hypothetical protein